MTRQGPAGLTVEALCEAGERTRGSFYHHFADHDAFVADLMQAWKQRHTLDIAEKALAETGEQRAQTLSRLANSADHALERAVRQYAQANPVARAIVREVDDLRTGFVAGLYRDQGLDPDLAEDIARIEYAAFVGCQIVWPDMPAEERMALDRRFAGLVARALGTADKS
ncbi:TetR/AcrR family transcriptional regulator [Roseibium sediminicola]|uniref:TetR/AcrR family transcriptional regulator n=1 Tax=Roseibium sediminicola TaxID=2933272 RepID=A0ABT0GU46_9HYPH|nr:TetR/AcrR family transcriptional regulator [Roseibium sp. CAU 1639]MCK7612370.1 TetR/AcrR family transcriptional regulator [Roseibium sp. CAU 1639]